MTAVDGIGGKAASVKETAPPLDVLAERDEALLAAFVRDLPADPWPALQRQTRAGQVHPVYFGSAITGAGVDALIGGITSRSPPRCTRRWPRSPSGEVPAASVHELRLRLPGLTRGEGLVESVFERWGRCDPGAGAPVCG